MLDGVSHHSVHPHIPSTPPHLEGVRELIGVDRAGTIRVHHLEAHGQIRELAVGEVRSHRAPVHSQPTSQGADKERRRLRECPA